MARSKWAKIKTLSSLYIAIPLHGISKKTLNFLKTFIWCSCSSKIKSTYHQLLHQIIFRLSINTQFDPFPTDETFSNANVRWIVPFPLRLNKVCQTRHLISRKFLNFFCFFSRSCFMFVSPTLWGREGSSIIRLIAIYSSAIREPRLVEG